MWGTVLVLALVATADPVRIGISVLLSSRPRPVLHLVACWLGGMVLSVAMALGVLFALRGFALGVMHKVQLATASSTAGHIQVAMGLLALTIAALTVGLCPRLRSRVALPGTTPTHLPVPSPPAFSRLSTRVNGALDARPLWVAFALGVGLSTDLRYLAALTAILASGAAAGTQITAVAAYAVVALAFVEIPLVSQLAAPAQTGQIISAVHGWVKARRQQIFAVVIAMLGLFLMTNGMSA
jgi:hypothetical protein